MTQVKELERRVENLEHRVHELEIAVGDLRVAIGRLESKIDTLVEQNQELISIIKTKNVTPFLELLIKYVIFPLIVVLGGLIGVKLIFPPS